MLARVNDLIDRIVLSFWPVPVCKFGVHLMRFTFSLLQNSLNSLLSKQIPLSVRILRGIPLSEQFLVKNFKTVRVLVFLQICAVGHSLKRSTATKIYTLTRVFDFIGPAGSNWISWLGSNEISNLFLSVDGNCVYKFLPNALQLGQFSDFSRISRCNPGHQNASAD